MTFTTLTIGDLSIRTAQSRAKGRPTLVVTNALPQSIRCWESQWTGLAARFDLIAVDLPGFGMSSGSGVMMRPSAQAAFLVQLFDALDIQRAFVVGPDIGVPIALWLAAQYPDRVLGVNVYDGPGTWPPDFSPELRLAARSRLIRWLGSHTPMRNRFMAQNLMAATKGGYHQFEPSAAAREEYRKIAYDREKNANALAYLGSYATELPRLEAMLPSIQRPVLITWGANDAFVLPSNAAKLHALLPMSEVTIFENAGHFSHEDAGEAWLTRFVAFVDRCL